MTTPLTDNTAKRVDERARGITERVQETLGTFGANAARVDVTNALLARIVALLEELVADADAAAL